MIGTSSPYFKQDDTLGPSKPLKAGNYYLALRFHSGNVIKSGGFWDDVNGVAVTSEATLSSGNSLKSAGLNEAFPFQGVPSHLVSTNKDIIGLIPATVPEINVTVKYTVSRHDRVSDVVALAQNNSLATVLGLSSGTQLLVDGIANIVPTVINLFRGGPETPQSELLNANLTIDLSGDPILPGIYVWFAASDSNDHEVDNVTLDQITVENNTVMVNGNNLEKTSYLALELRLRDTLSLDLYRDEEWVTLYYKALDQITEFDFTTSSQEQETALQDIQKLIVTVRTLLLDDRIFTTNDQTGARTTLQTAYQALYNKVHPQPPVATAGLHAAIVS